MTDVRWRQRFSNYRKALRTLSAAVALASTRPLSDLEKQGLIQSFEFTHELAWKVLKDFLEHKGITGLVGSRDATRSAFQNEIIKDGETWMEMIHDRNLTSHTYDQDTADQIVERILEQYHPVFDHLAKRLSELEKLADSL